VGLLAFLASILLAFTLDWNENNFKAIQSFRQKLTEAKEEFGFDQKD